MKSLPLIRLNSHFISVPLALAQVAYKTINHGVKFFNSFLYPSFQDATWIIQMENKITLIRSSQLGTAYPSFHMLSCHFMNVTLPLYTLREHIKTTSKSSNKPKLLIAIFSLPCV